MNRKFTMATMVAIAAAGFGVPATAQDIPRYVPSIGKHCPEGYVYLPSIHRGRACQLGTSIRPDPEITCTGILIDLDVRPRAIWPLAVIYDEAEHYACTIDRGNAGHDPLKPCSVGEKCQVDGTYRKIGNTYAIQTLTSVDRVGPQQ